MYPCPQCQKDLTRGSGGTEATWHCADGHGQYLGWPALGKVLGSEKLANLWQEVRNTNARTGPSCVGCGQFMALIHHPSETKPLPLCPDCRMAWCAPGALESLGSTPIHETTTDPVSVSPSPRVNACPVCGLELQKGRTGQSLFWACPESHGWLLSLSSLRLRTRPEVLHFLWSQIRSGIASEGRPCPTCGHAARVVTLVEGGPPADVCPGCQAGWFNAAALQSLPPPPPPPEPEKVAAIPEEAKRLLAEAQIRQIAERGRDQSTIGTADHWWQYILGFLGLPIRLGQEGADIVPWASILLGASTFLIGAAALLGPLEFIIQNFGMVPGDLMRAGGLGFVTCFFIHADWFHLLSNLYMMALVSPMCEQSLGRKRFFLLMALALLGSELLDLVFHPAPMEPRIGASGAIAGLLAYFAFQFPGARFGFLLPIRFTFLKLPAWAFIILWFFSQVMGSFMMVAGETHVNYLAHLGGALTGVGLWFRWRKPDDPGML